MRVRDVMTTNPIHRPPGTTVRELARLMAGSSCGEIPITRSGALLGVVTDRDITCRLVATGSDPETTVAEQIMSYPVIAVGEDDSVEYAMARMERANIRRIPVTDGGGCLVGILSQVDIATRVGPAAAAATTSNRLDHRRPLPLPPLW